jgi:hypothetical protein
VHKTYIFDIDNTLCDTWPTLNFTKKNYFFLRFLQEARRVSLIPPFENMMTGVSKRIKRKNTDVYFLSARHRSLWPFTYVYLVRHIGFFNPSKLILVPSANDKIKKINIFLTLLIDKLIVVDDLSYNTENGQTLYYTDVIKYLTTNNRVKYIGKSKIDLINSKESRNIVNTK